MRGDRPTRILRERIEAAVGLYRLGRVDKLLMTGDNSSPDYDEVTAMRRYAEGLARYSAREALATAKALADVHLTRPLPTFLGTFEGLE